MKDRLCVPHSPQAGDSSSFHSPLHRDLAKGVRTQCSIVVPDGVRSSRPRDWWKLSVMGDDITEASLQSTGSGIRADLLRFPKVRLVDEWSLRPFSDGPLPSKGRGENRGSILELLIALYEHRSDHGGEARDGLSDSAHGDKGHGGAKTLAASGLKWLLRFNDLVNGTSSVGAAAKRVLRAESRGMLETTCSSSSDWTLDMLSNLGDLWPKESSGMQPVPSERGDDKGREARKAPQLQVTEMIKRNKKPLSNFGTPRN